MSNIWHPYTQHKTAFPEVEIARAKNTLLYTPDGKTIIDAVSSWWVNPYGHGNERLAKAIYEQILHLDQIIFAGFTHQPAIQLAERLLTILPSNQQKIFFSDNGSTAVEVAMKMAIQYFFNLGKPQCTLIAFEGAYHGDTFGAMAAGERGKFFAPFESYTFSVKIIPAPTPGKELESETALEKILQENASCCFLFEPLVQGAGGMIMHSPEALDRLIALCKSHDALTIADEVMTGFGRTGKNFACDYLEQQPDLVCMSKCLTGGILPMSITSCTAELFDAFYSDDKAKTLFHGHSYTGNPVGCAAALTSIEMLLEPEMQANLARIAENNSLFAAKIAENRKLSRIQFRGTILALEIASGEGNNYFSSIRDKMYDHFLQRGILLRPLGNVLYIMPPYCITDAELNTVYNAILEFLEAG
ncbi:MAG: adenosylmethionine--8-amino-7-oxononanoate transaminase [Bacteroidota bacterium]